MLKINCKGMGSRKNSYYRQEVAQTRELADEVVREKWSDMGYT